MRRACELNRVYELDWNELIITTREQAGDFCLGESKIYCSFSPRLEHETAAIEEVPTRLSYRIRENLTDRIQPES